MTTLDSGSELIRMGVLCCGLALLVMSACFINTYSAPITCDAGTYVVGQPASITCNFRTNISASQQSFNMARYPPNAEKGEIGTDVLVCHWSDANHKHDCTVTYGYDFNNVITEQVTVEIPETEEAFEGLYMCFFVPSQGKDAHACDFKITFEPMDTNDTHTDPPSGGDHTSNTSHTTWIAAVGVIVAITIIVGVLVYIRRRHQNKNHPKKAAACEYSLLGQPSKTNKQIQKLLEGFELPKKNLEAWMKTSQKPSDLMNILKREIKQGLDNITRSEEDNTTPSVGDDITKSDAALQMNRLHCPLLDQADNSDLLVVDLGCAILKMSLVGLRIQKANTTSKSYVMKTGTGNQMFASIADSITTFVYVNKLTKSCPLHTAIILPFPCHQTTLKQARLAKCSREVCCEDIVNKDIQELLQQALQIRKTPFKVNIVAIVNDAVSTLVSVAHKTPECKIGLTVDTGFNACFVEQWSRVGTSCTEETQPEGMVYNTELGALGDNDCLTEYRTDFDRDIDILSSKPGSQIFEKMVSWTYIGDIVRLTLKSLRQEDLLLPSEELGCMLFQQGSITSDHVAIIASDTKSEKESDNESDKESDNESNKENDTESPYQKTRDILAELEVTQYTDKDLNAIRYVCSLVCERATYLTAAALATLINRLNQPGVMVVVDGELNKKLPRFGELLYSISNKLVKPELKYKFLLVSSNGRRNLGAALIAAASMRQAQAAASSHSSLEKTHC